MSCFREQGFLCKIPAGTELGEGGQSSYAGKNLKIYFISNKREEKYFQLNQINVKVTKMCLKIHCQAANQAGWLSKTPRPGTFNAIYSITNKN